jgi:hypothetical protein
MSHPVHPADPNLVQPTSSRPAGHRSVPLLTEHQLDHYPEFAEFFRRVFPLDADPFGPPGLVSVGPRVYELTFHGRSGRPFPCGLTLAALVADLEPLDETSVEGDLWAILTWIIDGVGGPWTIEGLETTGRIYRIVDPAAGAPGSAR